LKKILLISSILFTFTTVGFANLIGLTPIQLEKKIKENNIKVIDIRTPMEWKETGIIKNSHKLMFFSMQGKVNSFVQSSMVAFKKNLSSAKSFFKGFF
jgi:rhodanese-related sulfurtransferase